jgi:cytochrome bd-type quinol oxidase subunit 2
MAEYNANNRYRAPEKSEQEPGAKSAENKQESKHAAFLGRIGYLLAIIVYLLACLFPIVTIDDNTQLNVLQLPLLNIAQVVVYPVGLLIVYLFTKKRFSLAAFTHPLSLAFSVINLVFLFLLPNALVHQVRLSAGTVSGQNLQMQLCYYVLYFMTLCVIGAYFIPLLLRGREKKEQREEQA